MSARELVGRSRAWGGTVQPPTNDEKERRAALFTLACRLELETSPAGRALVAAAADYLKDQS